jgi:hypothetical protein
MKAKNLVLRSSFLLPAAGQALRTVRGKGRRKPKSNFGTRFACAWLRCEAAGI